jgi:GAF domain-containing protein
MVDSHIRCGLIGGQERDLYVLGELHKRPDVEIAFVYDRDANAVGMEIAEILGLARLGPDDDLVAIGALDFLVVPEPREQYAEELETLAVSGARVLSQPEALDALCPPQRRSRRTSQRRDPDDDSRSLDEALAAFERLFDRERLLEFLLDVSVRAAGADNGSIMLYSEDAGELYIAYATGLSERVVRNTRQKIGEGIAGTVARERKGKLIRQAPGQTAPDRDRPSVQSAISVPLVVDDQLLGVLNVSVAADGGRGGELTDDALRTLERLAVRIARLLGESLKLEETRLRHQEMNLRQSVGELAERSIPAGAKFSVISQYLADLVGADTVEIFVGTHEGDWLVLGGSNRRLSNRPEYIRNDRGALSRAYLEKRPVILTERMRPGEEDAFATSTVLTPLVLGSTLGVMVVEFSERYRLDEFLAIRDSVALELARFIASERRERRLKRELSALARISDGAPALLSCRTVDDLVDYLARTVADVLDCERVSVRVLGAGGGKVARWDDAPRRDAQWADEDEERFLKLKKSGEAYSLAFLDYAGEKIEAGAAGGESRAYHSLLAVPVEIEGSFAGGVIAYDRRSTSALDDATFTDVDRTVLEQLVAIAASLLRTLRDAGGDAVPTDLPTYERVLEGNEQRMKKVIDTEMARADRYHHSFSVLLFKLSPLDAMFATDPDGALSLVEEITKGIQTRTRKTDFSAWIERDTLAMLSLEGSTRVKFLVSRLLVYLLKDFETVAGRVVERGELLVGHTVYPGPARTPEALIAEARSALSPSNGG